MYEIKNLVSDIPPECPDASDDAAVAVDDDEAVLDFPEVAVALAIP